MPALENPRWEQFAQCIVAGLSEPGKNTYKAAYIAAGYSGRDHSAEVVASRMLRKVEPIMARVRELQEEQNRRLAKKLDYSKERVAKRLDKASELAEELRNPAAMVSAEMSLAKLFGLITDKIETSSTDNSQAKSMQDIGKMLLAQVGLASAPPPAVALALEANDAFVARLREISETYQGTVLEHQQQTSRAFE